MGRSGGQASALICSILLSLGVFKTHLDMFLSPALGDPDFKGELDDLQTLEPYQFYDSVIMPSVTHLPQDREQLEMSAGNSGSHDLTVHPEATRSIPCAST